MIIIRKMKNTPLKPIWKFASIIEVDKEYRVEGLNIWNYYWHCTDRNVEVVGPYEGQFYNFKEYEITTTEKTVRFVAGEFSNGEIGIFINDELKGEQL